MKDLSPLRAYACLHTWQTKSSKAGRLSADCTVVVGGHHLISFCFINCSEFYYALYNTNYYYCITVCIIACFLAVVVYRESCIYYNNNCYYLIIVFGVSGLLSDLLLLLLLLGYAITHNFQEDTMLLHGTNHVTVFILSRCEKAPHMRSACAATA